MKSQPKLPPDLAMMLDHMGLWASCYQPVTRFKKEPPRSLPNVARPDDPWHCVLRRTDRWPWEDGALASQAYGDTLRDAVLLAVKTRRRTGLVFAMSELALALGALSESIHARQD